MQTIYLMCGIPGSGKTTWVKKHFNPETDRHISRDIIRFSMLNENDSYFAKESQVIREFYNQIQQAIDTGVENIYIDATHLNYPSRNKVLIHIHYPQDTRLCCVVFDIPKTICKERNANRSGRERVPDDVIDKMYDSYRDPGEDDIDYDAIWYINADGNLAWEVYK